MQRKTRFSRLIRLSISPSFILMIVVSIRLGFFLMFHAGLIPSFRLQNKDLPIVGVVHLIAFDFIAIGLMIICEKIIFPIPDIFIRCGHFCRSFLAVFITSILTVLGIHSLTMVLLKLSPRSLSYLLSTGIRGGFRPEIPWGRGYTVAHVALQVALVVSLVVMQGQIRKALIALITLVALAMYSIVYMSRIMFIAPLIALVVLFIRRKLWITFDKRKSVFILLALILIVAIVTLLQGLRDYESIGVIYTKSFLIWGLLRFTDYFISTAIFSSHIAAALGNMKESELGSLLGAPEYVNLGSLGQLLNTFGIGYLFVILCFWLVIGKYWRRFYKGYADGLIVYPYIVYSLIEFPRIFEFTTVTGLVRLALLIFCGWLFRDVTVKWARYSTE